MGLQRQGDDGDDGQDKLITRKQFCPVREMRSPSLVSRTRFHPGAGVQRVQQSRNNKRGTAVTVRVEHSTD